MIQENKIFVSVIIVTFNAAKTLDGAIQSVLNQTYKNTECLIIDGASTDGTVDIIKKYNVDYISEPDKGIYDAMNKGRKRAKGEWILYLGADDELLPDGIFSLIKDCSGYDVVYGNTVLKFPSGNKKRQYAKALDYIKKGGFTCHQSIIMKKDVIEKLDGFDLNFKVLADYDLLLRAYLNNCRFKSVSEFISIFYVGGISSVVIPWKEKLSVYKKNHIRFKYIPFIYRVMKIYIARYKQKIKIKKIIE